MKCARRTNGFPNNRFRVTTCFTLLCVWASLFSICVASTFAQQLTPAWVELGEGGKSIARVIVTSAGECPSIKLDNQNHPMVARVPTPNGFRPLCEAEIPSNTKSASVNGQTLALPKPNPFKVIAFGDTGCVIKGKAVQDCKDSKKWPFEQVAGSAAAENPDLMIHVGDYLYRETPCPVGSEAKCGNEPTGDNWRAWDTDFFTPAAKLLASVPWAFARGNHEICDRSWRGWFYYLDPRPWTGECERYSAPYVIKLGSFELVMFDSSEVNLDLLDEHQASTYTAQLSDLHTTNAWLVAHHPFWGFRSSAAGDAYSPISLALQEGWKRASPKGITLILSGHVHLFELMISNQGHPPQLVAGGGGTDLAFPIPASLNGTAIGGSTIIASESQKQFGYTVLEKVGNMWRLTLKNPRQNELFGCMLFDQIHEKVATDRSGPGNIPNCGSI